MRNQETGLGYANTDASLHANQHVSEQCTFMDHAECDNERCACPHHQMTRFPLVHPLLQSLTEAQSTRDEDEDYNG